jgi:hypothetical protein
MLLRRGFGAQGLKKERKGKKCKREIDIQTF